MAARRGSPSFGGLPPSEEALEASPPSFSSLYATPESAESAKRRATPPGSQTPVSVEGGLVAVLKDGVAGDPLVQSCDGDNVEDGMNN